MIIISDKKNCCGCNGCVQICPVHCISMKSDNEGFWYPAIDETICIHCNKCNKVCPIENSSIINSNKPEETEAFICYTRNEHERRGSSSGGIFYELSKSVIEAGGVVFGAAFADDFSVNIIEIDCLNQLFTLQGSKYLQAKVEETYKTCEKILQTGRLVLYSATPCYIAGLKSFLKKDYSNLILVDVLCHGVPSPLVWEKYIEEKELDYGSGISQVNFRYKESGWHNYALKIDFLNEKTYNVEHFYDDYMKLFLGNICLRPCCHECHFKEMNRPSDITIGDCWGVENNYPEMDDNKGTSVALIHTIKGKSLFNNIASNLIYKKTTLDISLPPSSDSRKSVSPNKNRTKFFIRLNNGETIKKLTKLTKDALPKRVIRKVKHILIK